MNIHQYPNQLKIVMEKIPQIYSSSIGIFLKVGGRYENSDEKGLSHFLEHLVFKGTKKRNCQQIKQDIEGIGGTFNAFTSKEYTCFYAKVPEKDTLQVVDILTDMVFDPLLNENDIENEKQVVIEEINMNLDSPTRRIDDCLDELLWDNHPLGVCLTGTAKDIHSFSRNDCLKFTEKYYQPTNTIVSIAGNIDENQCPDIINNILFDSKHNQPSCYKPYKIKDRNLPIQWINQNIEQTHLALGFYAYHQNHPLYYALNLLNVILGGNMSSRLFNELREKKAYVYDIQCSCSYYQDTGSFEIYSAMDSNKLIASSQVIQKELLKIQNELVPSEELTRAKSYSKGQIGMAMEKTMTKMSHNAETLLANKKMESLETILEKIDTVTSQDILTVAQEIFQKNRMVITGLSKTDYASPVREAFHCFD